MVSSERKLISYIFPIYNEAGNIALLYKTLHELMASEPKYDYELLFVDDYSSDDSLEQLKALQKKDKRIVVIEFARNYGHQIAVTAGVDHARGDAVIIMDSDMQDPPRVSFDLINRWEEGHEVVYAQRASRKDTAFKRFTAYIFYWMLQKLTDIDIPRNTGDFRLMDRKVVEELKKYKEHNRFLRGMISYIGFKQIAVQFDRDERHAGETGYTFRKMINLAGDGILSFSTTPLKIITRTGYIIAAMSFLGIIYAVAAKIYSPQVVVPGWTFIVSSVLFIGGVQLMMLGVLGGYIGRIYTESQGRPLYGIRKIYKSDS